jgi:hypothetical protein
VNANFTVDSNAKISTGEKDRDKYGFLKNPPNETNFNAQHDPSKRISNEIKLLSVIFAAFNLT